MPTIQDLYDLNLKIANAKTERDNLYGSIYNSNWPGGSWLQASVNECGKEYKSTEPKGSPYYPVYISGSVDKQIKCNYVIDLINDRIKIINKLDQDILSWQNQANGLLKNPEIQQAVLDAEQNRKIKTGIIIVIILAAISGVVYFIWKKYKK